MPQGAGKPHKHIPHHEITLGNGGDGDPTGDALLHTKITRPGELTQKRRGKYVEIPQVLDGFFMLNKAPADDPDHVYLLDITGENLCLVIEDDLTMFTNLQTLRCGENSLPFAKLGVLPGLRQLTMPCNGITDLDLEVEGRFLRLEELDLSYNRLTNAGIIVLASLPSLRKLDLSTNNLATLAPSVIDMSSWRDKVIESILPKEELEALEGWMAGEETTGGAEQHDGHEDSRAVLTVAVPVPPLPAAEGHGQNSAVDIAPGSAGTASGRQRTAVEPPPSSLHESIQDPVVDSNEATDSRQIPKEEAPHSEPALDTTASAETVRPLPPSNPQTAYSRKPTSSVVKVAEDLAVTVSDDFEEVVEARPTVEETLPSEDPGVPVRPESACDPDKSGSEELPHEIHDSTEEKRAQNSDQTYVQAPPDDQGSTDPPVDELVSETSDVAEQASSAHENASEEEPRYEQVRPAVVGPQTPAAPASASFQDQFMPFSNIDRHMALFSAGGPGFRKLETLTLDNNRMNTLAAFQILGALPCLKSLDLSRNRIRTLDFLTPPTDPALAPSDGMVQKFDGFYTLQDLYLTYNVISTPEDLLGIVFLPVLERVFLEGNPIMQRGAQKMAVRDEGASGEVLGYVDFDPQTQLPGQYNITVSDAIYNTPHTAAKPTSASNPAHGQNQSRTAHPPSHIAPVVVAPHPRTNPLANYHTTTAASKFLSHVHRKNAPPAISAAHIVASHTVRATDPRCVRHATDVRKTRRAYTFTDQDLREIVRRGYIPDVRELVQFAEERERVGDYGDDDGEDNDLDYSHRPVEQQSSIEEAQSRSTTPDAHSSHSPLQYDPNVHDSTFLTSVHITGGNDSLHSIQPEESVTMSYISTPPRTESPVSEEDSTPIPKSLPAALRALRHALASPLSSWTTVPKPYTHATFASTRKAFGRSEDKVRRKWDPKKKPKAWSNTPACLPRLQTERARAKQNGVNTYKDEFAQMRRAMEGVDERIQIVETNLANLLDPMRAPSGDPALIGPSRKLLDRVQSEYTRIERMYAVAALANRDKPVEQAVPDQPQAVNV
ncbi:X-ray radiation resistance-associated protein 1 [Thoreauomyces humboldtii]|nr:X-ray radiation resistance-associated protein 1 [Thoreauomyces humboldtii]